MSTYRYKNILLFASPQFAGNIQEYFISHTEKLIIYETMPRFNNKYNTIRHYNDGKMLSEKKVISSGNIFLYYFFWYITYLGCLKDYYSSHEEVFVITWQPYFLVGGLFQKMFRKIRFVYWVGDYFPPVSTALRLFEQVKKYYATHAEFACYLSDRINKKMNGKVLNSNNRKTIAWGVKPTSVKRNIKSMFTLCFIGVIKPSQGLEVLLEAVRDIKDIQLKILGASTDETVAIYKNLIKKYNIEKKVYFPNKMFYGKEIEKETKDCSIGVALYDVDNNSATYYADPGKIKTYAQYGLPILMTPIADVEKYIRKFSAGEIVSQDIIEVEKAIKKMKRNYSKYLKGLSEFNNYFNYETYYEQRFRFLEE